MRQGSTKTQHREPFDGAHEPKMENRYLPWRYGNLISTIESERFKLRTWREFQEHTGHWPLLSIFFHFVLWLSLIAGILIFCRMSAGWGGLKFWGAAIIGIILWIAAAQLSSSIMRKIDWKLFGPKT